MWRGEIYDVDLGTPVGHEPAFRRPAVVVSSNFVSNSPGGLIVVVPVASRAYGLRSHIELDSGPSGLDHVSYARCDQLRVVSAGRITGRRGSVGPDDLRAIDDALRFVLGL